VSEAERTQQLLLADLNAWAKDTTADEVSLPDFWDELCASERLADHLAALGYRKVMLPRREHTPQSIDSAAQALATWLGYAWDGLSDRDISAEYPDWAFNGIGALHMQGGKPARAILKASDNALFSAWPRMAVVLCVVVVALFSADRSDALSIPQQAKSGDVAALENIRVGDPSHQVDTFPACQLGSAALVVVSQIEIRRSLVRSQDHVSYSGKNAIQMTPGRQAFGYYGIGTNLVNYGRSFAVVLIGDREPWPNIRAGNCMEGREFSSFNEDIRTIKVNQRSFGYVRRAFSGIGSDLRNFDSSFGICLLPAVYNLHRVDGFPQTVSLNIKNVSLNTGDNSYHKGKPNHPPIWRIPGGILIAFGSFQLGFWASGNLGDERRFLRTTLASIGFCGVVLGLLLGASLPWESTWDWWL
jgi:hypothetical protein